MYSDNLYTKKSTPAGTKSFESTSAQCPDASGTMPSCAPLAYPYVPFQQRGPLRYNHTDALNNGTLYPGLNLPFHLKVDAANVSGTPLAELQALDFVVLELALYLDTHSDDQEAFDLYQQYAAAATEVHRQYAAAFGPLNHRDAAQGDRYAWLDDPWPWNLQTGKGK